MRPIRNTIVHTVTLGVLLVSIVLVAQQYTAAVQREATSSHIASVRPRPGPAEQMAVLLAPLLPGPAPEAVPLPRPRPLSAHVAPVKPDRPAVVAHQKRHHEGPRR